jgi:1A family penicillin-binding protein
VKRARLRRFWNTIAIALLAALIAGGSVSVWWLSRHALAVQRLTRGIGDTTFYGADGRPWFRLDERRHDVPLDGIAVELQKAIVAVEDHRFYGHPGLDPIGIARAALRDLRARSRVEGGSTITQQLARTLFLSNVRTFGRKAKEAALAVLIEAQLTKPQILELYLNRVYLGAGVYGVEAMSQHLFRKPASALTLTEAALVAGLVRAPSALSPWSNYEGALARSHVVLGVMREHGVITPEEETRARRERPRIQPYRAPSDPRAGWAKEYLRQQFRAEFGGDHPPDWRVDTTFVPALQEAAEAAVKAGVRRLGKSGLEAALVAMDPATGDLLALVGGTDYARSTFNRATRARRQPGSAFKPFVYAAALSNGLSPVSVLPDLRQVAGVEGRDWMPSDAAAGGDGLTLRAALRESNNAAAVHLQQTVGTRQVRSVASDAGLRDLPDVPSLALGTGLVTPLELTAAYSVFPAGGFRPQPRSIVAVLDADGDRVFGHPIERDRVLAPDVAFQMVSMLQDVVALGTGSPARALGVKGPIAGKTGTTDGYRDAWFVGFSTAVVAAVWVGFDQPAAIGSNAYAARTALPIWADFMKRVAAVRAPGQFTPPASLEAESLCKVSFRQPVDDCPTYTEYFKRGDEVPSALCHVHRGSLPQRASRAVQDVMRSVGRAIAGLFRR